MSNETDFLSTLKQLKLNDPKHYNSYLQTFDTLAILMLEINSNRFTTAQYTRQIQHDRLEIVIKYNRSN